MSDRKGRIEHVQIALLGPLMVVAEGGAPIAVAGGRLRTLLILLALEPGRVVTTSYLIDGVWGDAPPAEAANALQALVSRLRRAGLTVESRPAGYVLAVAPDDVDSHRFERLAAAGRKALDTDPAAAAGVLRTALALWRGPALADVSAAEFAQAPIARLTELRLGAIGDRAEADLRAGVPGGELVAELESLVAEHPLHEPFAARLMRALASAGRTGDALAVFTRTKDRLAAELGADPAAELRAVHVTVLRGAGAKPNGKPNTNLRATLTSFVGRDAELARVAAMVGESRLVTLTGPGGSGKTRLAIEAGRALLTRPPADAGDVWLVELAPVAAADVAQAVLSTLGLRAQPLVAGPGRTAMPEPTDPVDRLAAALSTRHLVLMLDNCEHVIGAAAALVHRLLGDCPGLRILATSREPLGITGETLWPVDPLTLPPVGASPAEALSYPAMRLLAERARAVRPGLTTDDTVIPTMDHVCRALDGMPLAIELAAARLRTMSLDVLANRLDDRFRLLTGGSRTALPRHQTLRAVVDWSWELLDDRERMLLRRLSVFAGGATLEAVEQVCSDMADVLDLLTALVDKSLVILDVDRYRLLETIKAYGQERLTEAGEDRRIRTAFCEYFARLAETAEPHLRRAEQLDWLDRLDRDHDNLHAAVRTAVADGDTVLALRLVCNIGWYWWLQGDKVEAAELAGAALDMVGDAPVASRAMALAMGALVAIDGLRDEKLATRWFEEAVELAARAGAGHPMLRLVGLIHEVFQTAGLPSEPFQQRIVELLTDDDPWIRGTVLLLRAHAAVNAGRRHEAAEADFRAALAEYRSIGERWGMSNTLCALAEMVAWRGDLAGAIALYRDAVALFGELVTNEDLVRYRLRLASMLYQVGEHEAAASALAIARREAERTGLPECLASVAHTTGEFARLAGDFDQARVDLERAALLAGHVTVAPQFGALVVGSLGYLETAVGNLDAALARHQEALRLARRSNDAPVIAQVLVGFADVAAQRGEPERAAVLLGASYGIRGVPDLSLVDLPRVEAATRAAVGEAEFAAAVERGRATTVDTLGELLGVTFAA